MAEAQGGGGDPVLMIRGVLDMTQPYQELQNLGRAASEGTTFSNSGTPGTSSNNAARERASRAVERQADLGDADQASFNVSRREQGSAASRRGEIGVWGDVDGPSGGVIRFHGRQRQRTMSTGRARQGYRRGVSSSTEEAVENFLENMGDTMTPAAELAEGLGPAGFDFPSGGYGSDPLAAGGSGFSRRRGRTLGRQRALRSERAEAEWESRFAAGPADFGMSSGGGGDDPLSARRAAGPRHARGLARQRGLRESRAAEANNPFAEMERNEFGQELMSRVAGQFPAEGGSWLQRNLPSVFGRGGEGGGGGMSVFYRRFLAMEALRGVSQLASAAASAPGALAAAGGDQMALASAQHSNLRQVAESVPFVGGLIFGAADIISGSGSSIARSAASVSVAEQLMGSRQSMGDQRYALLQQSRVMAAPRGFARETQRISEQQDTANRASRATERQAGTDAETEANAARADLSSRVLENNIRKGINLVGGFLGVPPLPVTNIDEEGEEASIAGRARGARGLAATRRQADEEKNATIAATHQRELAEDMMLTRVGGVVSGGVAASQARSAIVLLGSAMASPQQRAAQAIQSLMFGNQTATAGEDVAMLTARVQGGQEALDAIAPGINLARQARATSVAQQSRVIQSQADRETTQMNIGMSGAQGRLRATLARDPYAGLTAQYREGQEQASQLAPEFQKKARENTELQQQVGLQEIRDRQLALGGQQALSLGVSGILATAVGPGAADKRRQASIMQIAGSAELSAQSMLRDESLGNEQERIGFANNARQQGANNLAGYRAQYLQGFRSVSRSRFEIAPGNQESTNPSKVLDSIDNAMRGLKGNMGSGDITGMKGSTNDSVPGKLDQIIQLLATGGLRTAE